MGRLSNRLARLNFALYCLKKSKDSRFIKRVRASEGENDTVTLASFGNKTEGNIIYFINMEESHSGFFAEHNRLLALLYFADKFGMKPVVRFHTGYCYAEKHPVNETENPFEYYFEQPCGISLEAMREYRCVLCSKKENSSFAVALNENPNGYTRSENYIDEMARITSKYIRLNKTMKQHVENEIGKLLGNDSKSTLAVHVRGTDFKQNYNGHPIKVDILEYLQETERIFNRGNYNKIFLATDDTDALNLFREKFGDKLVYYKDVVRSSGNDTVMHSTLKRDNHHYLLGVEVLRDMYTLAACEGLIAGLSQVSYAARIQKKSMGKNYKNLLVIDKGINYHQKENCPD